MRNETCRKLSNFAHTVDIVDEVTYAAFRDELCSYFRDTLRADVYEVFIDGGRVKQESSALAPSLRMIWSGGKPFDLLVGGAYQTTYAYVQNKPLWIEAEDGKSLNDADASLHDRWSASDNLPPYRAMNYPGMNNAIVVPLSYGERVFGVLNLEFSRVLECTRMAMVELEYIAKAVSRIVWLHDTYKRQLDDTHTAFDELRKSFIRRSSPLERARLFLASPDPDRSDLAVLGEIRNTVGKFSYQIETVYWKEIASSGNVTLEPLKAIASCDFGLCYFSEKRPGFDPTQPQFFDNPNVVFEAGMLHALSNDPITTPQSWIPVRERVEYCSSAPFDFASERMVIVPRIEGQLNTEAFAAQLKRRIESMLSAEIQATVR